MKRGKETETRRRCPAEVLARSGPQCQARPPVTAGGLHGPPPSGLLPEAPGTDPEPKGHLMMAGFSPPVLTASLIGCGVEGKVPGEKDVRVPDRGYRFYPELHQRQVMPVTPLEDHPDSLQTADDGKTNADWARVPGLCCRWKMPPPLGRSTRRSHAGHRASGVPSPWAVAPGPAGLSHEGSAAWCGYRGEEEGRSISKPRISESAPAPRAETPHLSVRMSATPSSRAWRE